MFSGLNLGLMSLDVFSLKRKMELGDIDAMRVYPIRKKGNLLLATILFANIAVNSAIAIILESIAGGVIAGIIATGTIFILGDVLPQAFVSRFALRFSSITAPITKFFMFILYPICGPVAYALDKMLGNEIPTIYSKNEMMKFIAEHEDHPSAPIDADEERIIHGALQYSDKKVAEVMTSIAKIVFVNQDEHINQELLQKIKNSGKSRFPVIGDNTNKVDGILYAKDLVGITFDNSKKVKDLQREKVIVVEETDKLDNVLNKFLENRIHLFVVKNNKGEITGIVTIEDLIEEILKREIVDESEKNTI